MIDRRSQIFATRFERPLLDQTPQWISIINTGGGTFSNAFNHYADGPSFGPGAIAAMIDYDLDDRPDLIVATPAKAIQIGANRISPEGYSADFKAINYGPPIVTDKTGASIQVGDLDGNGLSDFMVVESGRMVAYLRNGNKPDMLTRAVDGRGAETRFTYQPISNAAVYTPSVVANLSYPLRAVNTGVWVVSKEQTSAGTGIESTYSHTYSSGVEDIQGRGFLGFDTHDISWIKGDGTSVHELLRFDNSHQKNVDPFVGQPIHDVTDFIDGKGKVTHEQLINRSLQLVYDDDFGTYWTYPATTAITESDVDVSGRLVPTYSRTTKVSSVDNYGHVLSATTVDGTQPRVYTATYGYSTSNWLIDTLMKTTDQTTVDPPGPLRFQTVTRTTGYLYDAQGGLQWKVIEPSYDASGNIVKLDQPQQDGVQTRFIHYVRSTTGDGQIETITDDSDFTTTANQRVQHIFRDYADRVFTTRVSDTLNHMVHLATEPGYGTLAAVQGSNGEYSRWQYDTFGRLKRSEPANGEPSSLVYSAYPATGVDPLKASLELQENGDAGDSSFTQYDLLGKPTATAVVARNDGRSVVTALTYDESQRLTSRSRPYFLSTKPSGLDTFKYDAAGRLLQATRADGKIDQYGYGAATDGLHVEHWDAAQTDPTVLHSTSIYDTGGRLMSETQHAAAKDTRPARDLTVTYAYTNFDLLLSTSSLNQVGTTFYYDRLGRTIYVADPSRGTRSFGYDAFGQQTTETLGSEIRQAFFDTVGRIKTLQTRDGTTTWTWDSSANGFGKLGSTSSASGVLTDYTYDLQSRLIDVKQTIGTTAFDVTYEPDSFGRINRILYPAIGGSRFATRYHYGAHGALDSIVNDSTSQPFWSLLETDANSNPTNASGQFPQFTLGKNIVVHQTENTIRPGLLDSIKASVSSALVQSLSYDFNFKSSVTVCNDDLKSLQQVFDYDELNRLEHWTVTTQALNHTRVRYDYDDFGSLRGRTYEIGGLPATTFGIDRVRGGGPYAVTSAGAQSYGYDAEGNESQAGTRTTTFSTFGLPLSIGDSTATYQLRYTASAERAEKRSTMGIGALVDDTIYVGGGLFRQHSRNGVVDNAYTVYGPNGPIAYLTAGSDGAVTSTSYILRDYLGSADTVIDGATSTVVETRKFDPFGSGFDPQNPVASSPFWKSPVPYGFTGHEHDLDLKLVNMKGRLFDPATARFLSPDLFGIDPTSSLGLNSYAYVRNDPATLRDPTGFDYENGGETGAGGSNDPGAGFPVFEGGGGGGGGGGSGGGGSSPSASNAKPYNPIDAAKTRQASSVQRMPHVISLRTQQMWAGAAYGSLQGIAPLGFLSPSPLADAPTFEFWRGFSQTLFGAAEVGAGLAGEALGFGLDATGIGAILGIPLNVGAVALVVDGGAKVALGIRSAANNSSPQAHLQSEARAIGSGSRGGSNSSLSRPQQRSLDSLKERLGEHQQKLDAYRANPDAFDNQGYLRNAPTPEIRQRIISGRINHLQGEIENFQNQINKLLGVGQ